MGIGHVKSLLERDEKWPAPMAKLVAIEMAYHADRKGICRVSLTEVAGSSGLSRVYVGRMMEALCAAGVFARLGHGRYGVRYTPQGQPAVKIQEENKAELARLRPSMRDGQAIAYTPDGRPTLVTVDDI